MLVETVSKNDKTSQGQSVTVTADNFEQVVLRQDDVPVLVDFWAPWCGPCRVIGPVLDEIARERGSAVVVGKVNVDEQPDLAGAVRIRAIPTLMLFKQGKLVDVVMGAQSKQALLQRLDSAKVQDN